MDDPATVLVVDDDQDIRVLLRHILADEGYEVTEAAGGWSAVAMIEHAPPDVVLLDLMMPDMSGWEVLERIGGRVPIVVLTALSDRRSTKRAFELGAAEVLIKTAGPLKLLAVIRSLIEKGN